MTALLLLLVCLLLGWLVARYANPPAALAPSLNWWVINVAFSALVLNLIPKLEFDWHLWYLIATMWFVFLGSWAFFTLLGRALHWSRERVGALTLVSGLGNTSFIGFPMVEALRGEEALKLAVFGDQAGTFLALGVGGTVVAALYSGKSVAPGTIARRVLLFPPFMSLIAGVTIARLRGVPPVIDEILARIGATLVPLALFSVGLQFRLRLGREHAVPIGLGLAWKLVLAPVIVWLVGSVISVEPHILTVAVLQAAMAPMISATILATQNDLEPQLANTLLGIGILLAFATVPIANALL